MADDRQIEDDEPFSFPESSFLKRTRAVRTEDGVSTWTLLEPPDLIDRPGDLTFAVTTDQRPEQIAAQVYGDPNLWWIIALANDIRLPYAELYPGRVIRIPDPAFVFALVRSQEEIV